MAFTEFYCQNGGSNLNAGSTTNNTAAYTSIHGNWANTTGVFTPTDGTTPASSVNAGDFASVYIDGATVGVCIARITTVAAGANGAITTSATSLSGSRPANQTATATIKVGGAWLGPNAASAFPFTLNPGISNCQNASNDPTRVNLKNDQTYSVTAGMTFVGGFVVIQGYTSTVGDGGRATIDAGTTNATIITAGSNNIFIDLIIANNATGTTIGGLLLTTGGAVYRCVVHDVRGTAITVQIGSTGNLISECEVYNFNKSNTINLAGIDMGSNTMAFSNYIHDGSGSNCNGIRTVAGNSGLLINGNIIDTCAGAGISVASSTNASALTHFIVNNNFYNCGYGIKIEAIAGNYFLIIQNNNFIKNTTAAFEGGTTFTRLYGYFFNNAYGTGTQANGSDYLHTGAIVLDSGAGNSTRIVYASNVTPWVAPTTGNFKINLATANFAGRSVFTQTDGTNTGTAGYPDIGAVQSLTGSGGTFSKEVSYGFA